MNKEKLIPRLRFKSFLKNLDWKYTKLGEVADIVGGGTPSTQVEKYWNGDINWFSPTEIGETSYLNSSERKITKLGLKKSSAKILPIGTVLFTSRAGIGKTAILEKESTTNQGFQSIVPKKNILNSYFIYSRSEEIKNYAEIVGAGSTFVEVSGKQLEKMMLLIPELKEQQKIGSFFEKIDKMIQLQQSKVNKVKNIKAAYLSEMFPKEGEKYPKRRFEGFQGVWRKIRLEQVLNQSGSGGTPRTTREDYYGGDIPFLGISDITNSNGYIFNTEKTITVNGLNNSAAWIVPKESISLAMYASVGKVAILKIKSATSQAFYNMVIKTQPTRDYIFQYLVKMEEENMWDRIISTGTQANLNAEKVRNLIIPIPIDIDEQEKIGSFFKNLDNQIYIEEEKLTKLEKLKQAYLNDMFV
ncbi:restriction endonuclease subunit S [Jeotgalibaca porci]|uniref:Restriction endonuclease subunit S n=1 Tax=Jeotgalibaca porci TaxID=1868793 RepID=A0A6G7WF66_9LACT|nr:restriction endonuclease subunit S [Jeotgalibaca porci]QIK50876.1 restriction endonuclease subunit S [Jeotgalibaca porci]